MKLHGQHTIANPQWKTRYIFPKLLQDEFSKRSNDIYTNTCVILINHTIAYFSKPGNQI